MKKTGFLKCLAALLVAALLAGNFACALEGLQEAENNFFVNTDPKYEKVTDRVQRNTRSNNYNGSVLIATDDEIILYGGPKALTVEGLPVDLYTTYNIGSCTKMFTAVAVFQLIEAGRISPDDSIVKYFPEYGGGRDVTIRHLLHMQSGIADYVNEPVEFWVKVGEQDMEQFVIRNFRDEISDEEFLENLYAAPLVFEPGTEMRYSNTNYHLLAMIIEQVSGMKYCDYLKENIFDACGMAHTTCMIAGNETSVPTSFWDLRAAGVVDENGYTMAPVSERGAGGVHTCVADLWAFDKALFSGQLVSAAALGEMRNFEMDYGCGLYPYGKKAYGHSGRDGTYTSQNIIIESEQFGRVYLIASTSSDSGSYGLDALVYAAVTLLGGY